MLNRPTSYESFLRKSQEAATDDATNMRRPTHPPIQYFTRVTTREVRLDDVVIPKHARVLISYGAANRDERRFDRADEFDITRPVINHLAFSTGKHSCAGQNLARLEGQAILRALASGVWSLELIA